MNKENPIPLKSMQTPYKIRKDTIFRSPLLDITPYPKKKKKEVDQITPVFFLNVFFSNQYF